ncbi:hypothetical protein CAEBREN_25866 [Caenorhabditis brenneri]|uniref:BTB domain-containing protein n=1 Tax=Caenorhabditis brenneri TaxID=135651 RepID=G0N3T2_CAEBE|nr:hypothetical protein CAEBREN_25866 [Caenorhabditis brenneri]
MPCLEKKQFTLSHSIDLSSVTYEQKSTAVKTHFSIPWCMEYVESNNRLTLRVSCLYTKSDEWEIDTKFKFKLKSANGTTLQLKNERTFGNTETNSSARWERTEFVKLREIEKHYAENGKFTIEAHLVIKKMNGFGIEKLKYFDESSQNHWDVIISVDGHKFHLSKAFLAFQSSYFERLLFGSFKEATQTEVELKEVDHDDFQIFLELIHGESAVNDTNIDGVLHLADMFDAPTAIRRCKEFLLIQSKWSLDEKVKLAERYQLKDLMMNLQQSSKEEKQEELEDVVVKPVKKPSKTSWFSCIRKQRD